MVDALGAAKGGLPSRSPVQTAVEVPDYRDVSDGLNGQKDPPSRLW